MTPPAREPLDGKVALIVGAGLMTGIGFACAKAMAEAGAAVAVADIPSSEIESAARALPAEHPVTAHAVDISEQDSVRRLVSDVVDQHGRVDVLVNAAAILEVQGVLDLTLESWERTFAVNARGTFLICQAVARDMVRQETAGRIIAVASNIGLIPRLNNAAYSCAKAAVIHLVRCMALELAQYRIRINALCPGSTATTMLTEIQAQGDSERLDGIIRGSLEQWRTGIPLGRLAEPEDQAAAAVFLASDAAAHITGQALRVDGGQSLF